MSQQLNLFNPVFLRQKKYFSAAAMLQLLGVVLAALVGTHGFQRWQLNGLEKQLAEAQAQHATVQRQLAEFKAAQGEPSAALQEELLRIEAQVKAREALLARLDSGELGNTEGFSRYLTALARQNVPGVWLTGFLATGSEGPKIIEGRMLEPDLLPAYLRALNKEEALRGHGFAAVQLTAREEKRADAGEARYVEFTLGATQTVKGADR